MATKQTVRFGVIGAGRIGKIHGGNLATSIPGAAVLAVADPVSQAACDLAEQYHIPKASADYHEIMDDPEIDAVAICSSTDTHVSMIIEAARAGKHIFCEKPISYDLKAIDEALAEVDRAGVKMMVAFNRRFDPNFRRVHDLITEGKIGRLEVLRITSRDPAPPPVEYLKVSGGLFYDMTIHDFDMARFLSGSEVEAVYTAATVLVDPAIAGVGDVDTCVITLYFKNGAIGAIDNSRRCAYGYDQRVEAFGSRGMAATLNNAETNTVHSDAEGVHYEKPVYFFLERYMEAYRQEMNEFVQALREDRQPSVTGKDGRPPVVIAKAAYRSLAEKRLVYLSEVE